MKKELLKEFETKFLQVKKDLKFKAGLKELDEVFFLKDFVADKGFVSESLSRQICGRINDFYGSWYDYLHNIVIPNPQSLASMTESQVFGDDEKNKIMRVMSKIMDLNTTNLLVGIKNDKSAEGKFIDDALRLWNEIKPTLTWLVTKTNNMWKEKAREEATKKTRSDAFFG